VHNVKATHEGCGFTDPATFQIVIYSAGGRVATGRLVGYDDVEACGIDEDVAQENAICGIHRKCQDPVCAVGHADEADFDILDLVLAVALPLPPHDNNAILGQTFD
jgi:hypothetical protein